MALAMAAFVLRGRTLLQPAAGEEAPFALAYPAVVWAALLWGGGSGRLAAWVCATDVAGRLVLPNPPSTDRPLQVGAFLIASLVIAIYAPNCAGSTVPRSPNRPKPVRIELTFHAWDRQEPDGRSGHVAVITETRRLDELHGARGAYKTLVIKHWITKVRDVHTLSSLKYRQRCLLSARGRHNNRSP